MPIEKIQILGERCSGTNYLDNLIQINYNIIPTYEFSNKHFFTQERIPTDRDDLLVLMIVRNPYDWLRSLHTTPHHIYDHDSNFSNFIRKIIISKEKYYNILGSDDPHIINNKAYLRKDYTGEDYIDIEFFQSVIDMRTYKMKLMLEIKKSIKHAEIISYDDLVNNVNILDDIAKKYNIPLNHETIVNTSEYKHDGIGTVFSKKKYFAINNCDLTYLNNKLDWNLENQFGFTYNCA